MNSFESREIPESRIHVAYRIGQLFQTLILVCSERTIAARSFGCPCFSCKVELGNRDSINYQSTHACHNKDKRLCSKDVDNSQAGRGAVDNGRHLTRFAPRRGAGSRQGSLTC